MFFSKWFEPKPFNQGYLPKKDGHEIFFMEFGNKKGKVVISTHGGPGGKCKPKNAGFINLKKYRYIMFDQRGCGGSLPFGEIKNNTTQDIIADMKRVLDFLNVKEKVIVLGASWGSTIALLFAEKYPEMVSKLLVSMIYLVREEEKNWMLEDSALFYPDVLDRIKKEAKGAKNIAEYYRKMVASNDVELQKKALSLYAGYENVVGEVDVKLEVEEVDPKWLDYSRMFLHYDANDFFVKNDEILSNIKKIEHIPTLIVHNRLDFVCPIKQAYELHKKMSNSKFVIVPDKGHSSPLLSKIWKREIESFLDRKIS